MPGLIFFDNNGAHYALPEGYASAAQLAAPHPVLGNFRQSIA
jgi:hypothetical protein